jgi:hypothetical protein
VPPEDTREKIQQNTRQQSGKDSDSEQSGIASPQRVWHLPHSTCVDKAATLDLPVLGRCWSLLSVHASGAAVVAYAACSEPVSAECSLAAVAMNLVLVEQIPSTGSWLCGALLLLGQGAQLATQELMLLPETSAIAKLLLLLLLSLVLLLHTSKLLLHGPAG